MKLCAFIPFNSPYCSFLSHNSLFPSITLFYCFWNFRRYCKKKLSSANLFLFCDMTEALEVTCLRQAEIHHRTSMKHQNQQSNQNWFPLKGKDPKWRHVALTGIIQFQRNVKQFFSPNLNIDSSTSTLSALLNRWWEKKENKKRKKAHHKKKPKGFPAVIQNSKNISTIVKSYVNCTLHRTEIRKSCPRAVHGKKQKMYVIFTHERLKGKKKKKYLLYI